MLQNWHKCRHANVFSVHCSVQPVQSVSRLLVQSASQWSTSPCKLRPKRSTEFCVRPDATNKAHDGMQHLHFYTCEMHFIAMCLVISSEPANLAGSLMANYMAI
jgi:hypothetical protein